MTTNAESDINLKTLQRVDSNIVDILDTASQVAIYKYCHKLQKWEGTDVEGTLFLYRRSLFPCHGFIIVNRLNTTNFVESITSDMQFQLQEPYLLYKNHAGDIIGSWFYECKDLQRISKRIQKIVLQQCAPPRRLRCASESESVSKDGGHDILALLSQAHTEYMKTTTPLKATLEDSKGPKKVGHLEVALQRSLSHDPVSRRRSLCAHEETLLGKSHGAAPNRLSPLFSHPEIASPMSDVDFLRSSPIEDHSNKNNFGAIPNSLGNAEWRSLVGSERDTHFAAIKQSLKSRIEESPQTMLQIHEAYVSSLRSVFHRD